MNEKTKKIILASLTAIILVFVYFAAKTVSPTYLKDMGLSLPLPVFTFLISIVDGFNPCNLFVLTLLMSLMLSESHSRKRIYVVGFSFVAVVYLFYYFFMVAWLNIFKYIGFVDGLRIAIGTLAVVAGAINCKEYFFYRKGITLMIQDRHVSPLKKKINDISKMIKDAPMKSLMGSAVMLAIFASLVELPCTAGFPIIYTSLLSGIYLENSLMYYAYIALYNLFYVLPLAVVIFALGYTFNEKPMDKKTMAFIKFVGGSIMLLLGILLLVNPALIGL
ncbi:MAG: hypothetical protein KAI53_03745 [Candidatus Aenigmarchaeota archaeon]|nr:hypothetical protein [Candidatus Aenigmarchaeota archaeon]